MLTGLLFALCCAALWVVTGGEILAAIGIYILSGNLAIVGMVTVVVLLRRYKNDDRVTQHVCGEGCPATKA